MGQTEQEGFFSTGGKVLFFSMSLSAHSFTTLKSGEKVSQAVGIQHFPMPLKGIWREKLAVSMFSVFSAI